jgi:hypothetical protein
MLIASAITTQVGNGYAGTARRRDQAHRGKAMSELDFTVRYHDYLRTFGIVEPGDRIAELRDLDVGNVRFFAYAEDNALRLKAAVTPNGVVTPGGQASDDWYGFLTHMPSAEVAAERIAWLETDTSKQLDGLPVSPTAALFPNRPFAAGIDPAQWALVTAPVLLTGDGVTLIAWFLPGGTRIPTMWAVTARPAANAMIERTSALDLLNARAGSADAAAADAAGRARRLLAQGTADERSWALQHIGDTADRGSVLDVSALLANADVTADTRLRAAGALARLADPVAITALGAALCSDADPEVRRASAQALGRIGGPGALQMLTQAAPNEPSVMVRAEIVHALAAQGAAAYAVLVRIAGSDPDATIVDLARINIDVIRHER